MLASILKDAIATANLADKLQRINTKLTRIEAIQQARKIETEGENEH